MAPKTVPPAAKQALVLRYLRESNTVHGIKELEKALPSIASINGMQVKDYLQALADESQIRVEKIGSGNWYWSFVSEEKKLREGELARLREEMENLEKVVEGLKETAATRRESGEDAEVRAELKIKYDGLRTEVAGLREELDAYRDNDPAEIRRKESDTEKLKAKAKAWTDNIYCLEACAKRMAGGDARLLEDLKRHCYGSEFVEGEGLRELDE